MPDKREYGRTASDAPEALDRLGQSLWLDNITRDLLDGGTLKCYTDELSVTGLTSNPTIFDHAISHSSRYDADIRRQFDLGTTGESLLRRWRSTSPRSRPMCREQPSSASMRPTFSASGTGVGGRYSMDSAIGLSTMIAVGPDNFRAMLTGFHAMDQHFRTAPAARNLPLLLGPLIAFYNNFLGAQTIGIMPYAAHLARFPPISSSSKWRATAITSSSPGPDRPDHLGRARHRRPALVLSTSPPGHEVDSLRYDRLLSAAEPACRAARPVDGQSDRAGRGAGLRQDGGRVEAEGSPDFQTPFRVTEGDRPTSMILAETLDPAAQSRS